MDSATREKLARALCSSKDINPDCLYQHNFEGDWPTDERQEYSDTFTAEPRVMLFHRAWRHYAKMADALIPIIDALVAAERERCAKVRKQFPILGSGGAKIDWQLVIDHGGQAKKNHYQSVERLAERGGLSWCELYAVLHDKPWQKMGTNDAIIACRALEASYIAAAIRAKED